MMGFNKSLVTGALIILLCFTAQIAAVQGIDAGRSPDNVNKFYSGFKNQNGDLPLGQLQLSSGTVYFPWSKDNRGDRGSSRQPEKEEIQMSGSHPQQTVGDLTAMNTIKERDVVYEGTQTGDSDNQRSSNSMDIRVSGKGHSSDADEDDDGLGDGIERTVDDALASSMDGSLAGGSPSIPGQKSSMNNMNIDVSGISASAINTAPGGNAVVNNNIIIKPVQVILVPTDSNGDIPAQFKQ
jgi:hypothetical protein